MQHIPQIHNLIPQFPQGQLYLILGLLMQFNLFPYCLLLLNQCKKNLINQEQFFLMSSCQLGDAKLELISLAGPLRFTVARLGLGLEDVGLTVLATDLGDIATDRQGLGFCNLGEDKILGLLLRVVDGIDDAMSVHSAYNKQNQNKHTLPFPYFPYLTLFLCSFIAIILLQMKTVREYLDANRVKILDLFKSQGKDGEMPATNLHAFLRDVFKLEEIRFIREGKDYFKEDESQAHTQRIIEQYYRTTPDGKSGKFYLYRITFSFQEVEEYLEYWLNTDRTINIHYQPQPQVVEQQAPKVNLAEELRESAILDNEFMDEQRIPLLREAYQKDIDNLQEMLGRVTTNAEESIQIQGRIDIYKQKLQQLQMKRTQSNPSPTLLTKNQSKLSPPKSKTQASRPRKEANLKLVFQYYARQNHLTGVKQSFQWIQHETQTINYQKLVHFLKQYHIFPEKPKAQKKLHNIYVRICSSTRDLNYDQFLQLLDKLPEILYEDQESPQQKKERLMAKIQAGSEKNKLFHNPFHSLEKANFRIDSQSLKYSFKLKPLQGKLESQVNHQLQWRRRQKAQARQQAQREKQQRQVQKLRKLMAIDPYHPLVVKNSDLLQKRSGSVPMQPIANLDNMQKFRDVSFDMKAQFGIADYQEDPLKQISRRYDFKRAEAVEKEETERMSVLMNGLIERSQAKAEKFSLSPRKRQVSSKLT